MKKTLIILLITLFAMPAAAKTGDRFTYSTTIGTGIAVSQPSRMPFTWQLMCHYNFNKIFSVGAGSGLSVYEKLLIPVFGDIKINLIKPRKFTPYLECSAGYSFAPNKKANGGLFINPQIGVQYNIRGRMKVLFAIGYEKQNMEQLKEYENDYYKAEYKETLKHSSISIKAGFIF